MKQLKKDLLLLANKLIEEIPDPRNAKEHHQAFIKKTQTQKKTIKKNYLSTKNF